MQAEGRRRGRRLVGLIGCLLALAAGPLAADAVAAGGRTATATAPATVPAPPVIPPGTSSAAFDGRGLWIWVLSSTDGGNLSAIVSQARTYGIGTVMLKSGDGSSMWSQFNRSVVATLHAAHLHVCAWQFVYGQQPAAEAQVGAEAVHEGADCLLIDAESQYEGRYVQAQTYITDLRKLIGYRYPLALAGFPYVDYHPAFPYSVFLGPGGAQFNAPQMYWKDIGVSVPAVFAHTYAFNEIYRRPIEPLGQLYNTPPSWQVRQFRSISRYYGSRGVSWWDWQEARAPNFRAISQPTGSIRGFSPDTAAASLGRGAIGDLVVWAQEHLVSAGERLSIDGDFGPLTQAAVESFQSQHGLTASGVIDAATWNVLVRYPTARVRWVAKKKGGLTATVTRAERRAGGPLTLPVPRSASAPARRNELAGAGGAGRPR